MKSRGFTLVEMLVVVSLIAIISAIIYGNFSDARATARDEIRKSSLKELQLAIELYHAQYGQYPDPGCGGTTSWTGPGPHSASWGNTTHCEEYIEGLVPNFIAELPQDPNKEFEDNTGFIYRTIADRSTYKVLNHYGVENQMVESYDDEFARCPGPTAEYTCAASLPPTHTYAIYSAGGKDW